MSEAPRSTAGTRCISMMRCHRSAGAKHTIINYTRIFQLCKICTFSPKKTHQKAGTLHIWKIQVYVGSSSSLQRCGHGSRHNRLSGDMTILLCNVCIFLSSVLQLNIKSIAVATKHTVQQQSLPWTWPMSILEGTRVPNNFQSLIQTGISNRIGQCLRL